MGVIGVEVGGFVMVGTTVAVAVGGRGVLEGAGLSGCLRVAVGANEYDVVVSVCSKV